MLDSDVSNSEDNDENRENKSSDEDSSTEQVERKKDVIFDNIEPQTNLTEIWTGARAVSHVLELLRGDANVHEKFFRLLAGQFYAINRTYVTPFEQIFKDSYHMIYRLDTNKLQNVSKFFAHLLFTDSISRSILSCIKLNEEDTTSSNRIFINILFQQLSEYMNQVRLNERIKDATLQEVFEGLLPRGNPKNTRFAINFFTSVGLSSLTDDLKEHLKSRSKPTTILALSEQHKK